MALLNANLEGFQEQDDFSPVPPGEYLVTIVDSEVKSAKSSGNPMAVFTFEILGPTCRNRKLWDRFVLGNEVAMSRLKGLAKAVGHRNPNFIRDTEELHGLRCLVRVKIEEQDGYDPKNVVTSFKPLESGGQTQQGAPAATNQTCAPPPPTAAGASPQARKPFPWMSRN